VICIDCAYNECMSDKVSLFHSLEYISFFFFSHKEIASLARQIGRCYSSNRRATNPVRLILTNWLYDSPLARECRRVNDGFDSYQVIK
jgi:hypothetical protein